MQRHDEYQHTTSASAGSASPGGSSAPHVITNTNNALGVTEFSLSALSSRPDNVALRIDWEQRTTAVTLVYNHTPVNASPSSPVCLGPSPRTVNCAVGATVRPNSSPCARRCPDRAAGNRDKGKATVRLPRLNIINNDSDQGLRSTVPPLPHANEQVQGAQSNITHPSPSPPASQTPTATVPQQATRDPVRSTPSAAQAVAELPTSAVATSPTTGTSDASATDAPVTVKVEMTTSNDVPMPQRERSVTRVHPYRHKKRIRGMNKFTRWYGPSESERPIKAPPAALNPFRTNLYVHRHHTPKGVQVWMFVAPRRSRLLDTSREGETEVGWRVVHPGSPHPDLDGYVLHLLADGTPGWVKEASAKAYDERRKQRQRMARYF